MKRAQLTAGRPDPLGANHDGGGVNFTIFSNNATAIELCLFAADGITETDRVMLPERSGPIWHGYWPGLEPGTLYGYRAHGAYDPEQGHRFNANKLLVDPYARQLAGGWTHHPALLGYIPTSPRQDLSFSELDSSAYVPKAVVTDFEREERLKKISPEDGDALLIYEAHVKGLTRLMPSVSPDIRGTYEAMACDPILDHLVKIGVTAVELLPVHAFVDEGFLLDRGLKNYWGYNTIGFFTPEPRYFGPEGLAGFRAAMC